MQKIEILVKPKTSRLEIEEMLGAWAKQNLAKVRAMGRLVRRYKTRGENLHWHIAGLRKGMGTVEVTYQPSTGKLTVLVHENRRGDWAGLAYKDLVEEIAKRKSNV